MKKSLSLLGALVVFGLCPLGLAQTSQQKAAMWEYITYPNVEVPDSGNQSCSILVGYGSKDQDPRLRFDVIWSGLEPAIPPEAFSNLDPASVRLHLPDGTVIDPSYVPKTSGAISMGQGVSCNKMYFFPYGPNQLQEGWFEFRIGERTYWVEVPYGFTRDPLAPLASADPKAGLPTLAPAMKKMSPEDRIVPWRKVRYDLGPIQNQWRLSIELENPFTPRCSITLYKENGRWELFDPKTALNVTEPGAAPAKGRQISARLSDVFRREDEFTIPSFNEEGRGWDTLAVSVGGKNYTAVVPSSLFKYTHGTAAHNHPQLIRVEPPR